MLLLPSPDWPRQLLRPPNNATASESSLLLVCRHLSASLHSSCAALCCACWQVFLSLQGAEGASPRVKLPSQVSLHASCTASWQG